MRYASVEIARPERTASTQTPKDLFERYRTADPHESSGLLYAIADRNNAEYPFPEHCQVLPYLMLAGRENDPWEPLEMLRKEARKVILRRIVSKLLASPRQHLHDSERYEARQCVMFFADDPRHCDFTGRDRDTLHAFLGRYLNLLKARKFGMSYHTNILWACAYAGATDHLLTSGGEKAIPVLQLFLLNKVTEKDGYWIERLGRHWIPPMYGIGTPQQVMSLCGLVLGNNHWGCYHRHAETLLILRSRME